MFKSERVAWRARAGETSFTPLPIICCSARCGLIVELISSDNVSIGFEWTWQSQADMNHLFFEIDGQTRTKCLPVRSCTTS